GEQLLDLGGVVLTVGVDLHDGGEPAVVAVAVARPHRPADAEVERQPHDHRPGGGGAVGGGVGGAVVDDQHGGLRLRGPHLAHHAADAVLLVQRGEDDEQLGRGDPAQHRRVHVLGGHRRATVTNSL